MHRLNSSLTTLMALAWFAPSWAAQVTTTPSNLALFGTSQLQLQTSTLESWNAASGNVTPEASDLQIIGSSANYTAVTINAPTVSVTYDDQTRELLGVGTSGGFRLSMPEVAGVSIGGWFSMRDLYIDFAQQRIQGTIEGQNLSGVEVSYTGTLFTAPSMTFNPLSWPTGLHELQLTGIHLQDDALMAMSTALGAQPLLQLGLNASAGNYGTLSISLFNSALGGPLAPAILPPSMAVAVPEPSTWVLMGLGLCGLMLTSRRKSLPAAH